jgi:hypothetical protein
MAGSLLGWGIIKGCLVVAGTTFEEVGVYAGGLMY